MIKVLPVAALMLSALAFAADDVVTKDASGEASLKAFGGSKEKAFDEAKKQALRSAVEQAAGVYVQGDTITLNSQLVQDRIYANSSGYVKKYDVLSQSADKDLVKVMIRAEIGTAKLDQDLQAVQGIVKRLGKSKLLIVTQEQSIDDKGISTKSEVLSTMITDAFKRDGWRIIDEKGTGTGALKLSSSTAMGVPDAKEVAKKSDADYLIYGSVSFRYIPPGTGGMIAEKDEKGNQIVFFVTGEYDFTMFEVQTGRQLAKVTGKFAQDNMMQVKYMKSYAQTAHDFAKRDAPRIIGELRNPVVEYLRNEDVNGAAVKMKVSGLSDFNEVSDFEKAIGEINNVRDANANGDFENGKQEYEVKYLGRANELAKAISSAKFKKKKLNVTAVRNNEIEVAIAK